MRDIEEEECFRAAALMDIEYAEINLEYNLEEMLHIMQKLVNKISDEFSKDTGNQKISSYQNENIHDNSHIVYLVSYLIIREEIK